MEQLHWMLAAGPLPGWAVATAAALSLLVASGAALAFNGHRLPSRLRPPTPAGLRARITLALMLMAIVPALLLGLALSGHADRLRTDHATALAQAHATQIAGQLDELPGRPGGAPDPDGARGLATQPGLEWVVTDAAGRIRAASPGAGLAPPAILAPGSPAHALPGASAYTAQGWRVWSFAPAPALAAARLEEYGVTLGWLLVVLVVAMVLASAFATGLAAPLNALDAAVRRFNPEAHDEVPAPPPGAPREVAVVFQHLASARQRQRSAHGRLRHSVRQGERLRRELLQVLENRETEIRQRTEQLTAANAQLDRLSRMDPLTGIANRRGLVEFMDRAWRAAQRDQGAVSLLMIDIDHFRSYNDTYGHARGDICLQAVANTINQAVGRSTDIAARYGGEQFAVVLGGTALEGALQVAEQLRGAIEALAIPHAGAPATAQVTVSVGVTSSQPARGAAMEDFLEAADRALDAAKEQGRNRVGYSATACTRLFDPVYLSAEQQQRPC